WGGGDGDVVSEVAVGRWRGAARGGE
ncbi:hypothetical protein Tco_0854121, partial [Tanacetum coccineum]